MKAFALLICFACSCFGQVIGGNVTLGGNVLVGQNTVPNRLTQDWESGALPGGWTSDNGSPTYNFTPALRGTYSLGLSANATVNSLYGTFSSSVEVYAFFYFKCGTALPAALTPIADFRTTSAGATRGAILYLTTAGALEIADYNNGFNANASTVGTLTVGTLYYVWFHYRSGNGATSFIEASFSTTLGRPTSGNNYVSLSNGVSVAPAGALHLSGDSSGTSVMIYDHIGVDSLWNMSGGW